MTDKQWNDLKKVVNGENIGYVPNGYIIDCPWLPGWYGVNIIDYFSNDEIWYKANIKAIEAFPNTWFLPGFWSEYGMCTEPSAFGAKCIFHKNEFPYADKTILSTEDIDKITAPNPETDGLLPFMLNRLKLVQPKLEAAGHPLRFSVSRGPLNIATFLMGVSEFMMACLMEPERIHKLLNIINDFLIEWHELQRKTVPTIDGMLVLDDVVGFIGEEEFKEFGLPYLKKLYDAPVSVKFFHNDAECAASAAYYPEIGINLYNPGIQMTVNEIKELTQNKITILGGIPPRDVLASAAPELVRSETTKLLSELATKNRFILSCAGGMPMGVSTENINAMISAIL
jgi:uroporphyrinogen-III decarboxylase